MNLNQVTIPSLDVAKAADFYRRLGLRLIVEDLPNYVRFECPEGTSTFSIHQVDQLTQNSQTVIYFECQNLDTLVANLKSQGIQFEADPLDQPWLWREAYLLDPDCNRICLYFAGENRLNPPWRIQS